MDDNSTDTPTPAPPAAVVASKSTPLNVHAPVSNSSEHQLNLLTPTQFAKLHTTHLLSHPPDTLLFPFLHGLEGCNEAQNGFFRATAGKGAPRYRGLVWVCVDDDSAEEDMVVRGGSQSELRGGPDAWDDEMDEDDDDDDEFTDDEDDEVLMDVDRTMHGASAGGILIAPGLVSSESESESDPNAGKHMHPVHSRAAVHLDATLQRDLQAALDSEMEMAPHESSISGASFFGSSPTSTSASDILTPPSSESSSSASSSYEAAEELPAAPSETPAQPQDQATAPTPAPAPASVTNEGPPLLTCSFRPSELLRRVPGLQDARDDTRSWEFQPARVPDGISLRNFGIQVPIYATLSDIVLYSASGLASPRIRTVAQRFTSAIDRKRRERAGRCADGESPLEYIVYVLDADIAALRAAVPELMMRVFPTGVPLHPQHQPHHDPVTYRHPNHIPVAIPLAHTGGEKADWTPNTVDFGQRERDEMRELTRASEVLSMAPEATPEDGDGGWRAEVGQIFLGNSGDVPIPAPQSFEPTDPFDCTNNDPQLGMGWDICVECHEMGAWPSLAHIRAAEDHIGLLDGLWAERCLAQEASTLSVRPPPNANAVIHLSFPSAPTNSAGTVSAMLPFVAFLERCIRPIVEGKDKDEGTGKGRRWSAFPGSPFPNAGTRSRSMTSPEPSLPSSSSPLSMSPQKTRPLKILVYSADGYTESSPLALTLLMSARRISLPEAYLELQVEKGRSFFVYPAELGVLRRIEGRLGLSGSTISMGGRRGSVSVGGLMHAGDDKVSPASVTTGRPRAKTSPWLPLSFGGDHQSWFNDPRFDGSFPSRVLPFLYLGNLNHASNAYMLHALGITHVVSVGECALVPPPQSTNHSPSSHNHHHHSSLWHEEREGRINVLDITGICDDGIDTLEPQLGPITAYIERARLEGGKVLVHCRVGVSRSATVVIAYVMKHLGLPLADAYLVVRSRRLSVLIQPNMRLLFNLVGWEVGLAKERAMAGGDEEEYHARLRKELARSVTWPVLAREVHALNDKYLR
ncbi:unnamed protein product [Mycena citricolor]|uniref:Uncharacterized protein n=1 Tax=Mycena citricolor TaxID=2018698 RepID=A0AAD2HFX8_9AGAR|nr:unnamed protein product [Mycena citricolor]